MKPLHATFAIAAAAASLAALTGCSSGDPLLGPSAVAGKLPRDALPDGLYHDFMDGKFDGAGHPLNAEVWQTGEPACSSRTGFLEAEGLGLWPGWDPADVVCAVTSKALGRGRFTLSARTLVDQICADEGCDPELPVLTLRVADGDGQILAEQAVRWGAFLSPLTYQNASLSFTHAVSGEVAVEVAWAGHVKARVDYVELFRSHRNLLITPPSGPLGPDAELSVEVQDPPTDFTLDVGCDDLDLTERLVALIARDEARWEDTEFRTVVHIPAAALLEGCTLPTRLRVSVTSGSWVRATSRITVTEGPMLCTFSPDGTRVLLTGFEPFPAASTRDNSSERAVTGFDGAGIADITVMTVVLPVEFDTAANMLADAITRCQPDVVVGFGQGRTEVDLETTAYNLNDSSAVSGGAPDNRGIIGEGDRIVEAGAAELESGLPLDVIEQALSADEIAVNLSDDPGRYVCNNLFYRIMSEVGGTPVVAGFVHLPRIPQVSAADQAMLETVVHHVVDQGVTRFREGLEPK